MSPCVEEQLSIVTTFAVLDRQAQQNIIKTIRHNINISCINCIYILTESSVDDVDSFLRENSIPSRYKIIRTESRPSFATITEYANYILASGNSNYVAIANSDIIFYDEQSLRNIFNILNNKSHRNFVVTLTRHEISRQIELFNDNGLPNFLSADVWAFNLPLQLKYDAFYRLGDMNCDLMFAYDLVAAGYFLVNPCLDTIVIHNDNYAKGIDYYDDQNNKESTVSNRYKFIASRANSFSHTVGIPWNKSSWIAEGYLPTPLSEYHGNGGIWLFINGEVTHNYVHALIASLDCLSLYFNKNLHIVISDDATEFIRAAACDSLKLNNRIYLIPVKNSAEVYNLLFARNTAFSKDAVFCSDISRLSKKILDSYDNICIVANDNTNNNIIEYDSIDSLGGLNISWFMSERYCNLSFAPYVISQVEHRERKCTLITSIYKSDIYLNTFLTNCVDINDYTNINHYFLVSDISDFERTLLVNFLSNNRNTVIIWHYSDPGLYECWNIGIRLSTTDYISSANVDDLRDPRHVTSLIGIIENDRSLSFSASALYPFYEYSGDLHKHSAGTPWYSDQQGDITFKSLGRVEHHDMSASLNAHNTPHCMPVWRRSLHDTYGYFNEKTYGTYADWAFWLNVTLHGEKGYLLAEGLGYYYVNQASHNRRGNLLKHYHQQIEKEFLPHFLISAEIFDKLHQGDCRLIPETDMATGTEHTETKEALPPISITSDFEKKLHLYGVDLNYGRHRIDFGHLINSLMPLHKDQGGVVFLPFIERYFVWGDKDGEARSATPKPITTDWIGIIHVPFDAPRWFHDIVYPEVIFESEFWKKSLPYCRGLIALSEDLRRDLAVRYPTLPNLALKFPTSFENVKCFNYTKFDNERTIVQVGDWLRKLQAIYQLKAKGYRKIMLKKDHTNAFLKNEINIFGDHQDNSVEVRHMISNDEYDELLSRSLVLCLLYATAANNLVIECIARKTPIIINSLPSVVEYLGHDYPLYAEDIYEASERLADNGRIKAAYQYLSDSHKKNSNDLNYDTFMRSLASSNFYKNL